MNKALSDRAEHAQIDCIGVFDSGVGGLSVLAALRQRLPGVAMRYIGDVAHAPYGERSIADVTRRCVALTECLLADGARGVVVACNTATVLAIDALRARWPHIAFVGVEPGVKPAAARSRTRRIAVMATPATAASDRLRLTIARHAGGVHVHIQPCAELANAIERGIVAGPALLAILRPLCDQIRAAAVDTVVLGCTHYRFVAATIQELLGPDVELIDTAIAIAERAASIWQPAFAPDDQNASVRVTSTGSTDTMQALLRECPSLHGIEVESQTA